MKKNSLLNLISIILMLAVIVCSVIFVGSSRDWFRPEKAARSVVILGTEGAVSVIRRGSGYSLKEGISLADGDCIKTAVESSASFGIDGGFSVSMNEKGEMEVVSLSEELCELETVYGSFYFENPGSEELFTVKLFSTEAKPEAGSVFSIESFHGTQTISVFKGKVSFTKDGTDESYTIFEMHQAVIVQDEDGEDSFLEFEEVTPKTMSAFLIDRSLASKEELCISKDALRDELARRAKETEDARITREKYEQEIIARGGTVPVISMASVPEDPASPEGTLSCTISIRCDTILGNMTSLTPGKEIYVTANGVILGPTHVRFSEGENVFDVLKRVCSYASIPLQYSWTVSFGGYYIEGINNLCEFDCGPKSGWMYKVNGWFPNYGCYHYTLKDGDDIVWAYTCEDLGADIGAAFRY